MTKTTQPKTTQPQPMPQPMPEWQREMARAVPTDLVQALVNDFRRGPPQRSDPRAPLAQPTPPQSQPGSSSQPKPTQSQGWVEPAPLGPPQGVLFMDRMMIVQDAIDRAALVERLAKAKAGGGGADADDPDGKRENGGDDDDARTPVRD